MPEPIRSRATRCAIYTRKSSEEGLDQDFNSLHAQREACEAYVTSQKHEGWRALPATYDDGGFSGGSMERPGLQRLLADIQAGAVDVVVVYKVDRLTRSLTDFAKIVEIFDRHGVSFVSVTQSFNTTTSMGRLTLNVLLSFAQFEREVTGERIRDKIAASKKKGLWMGGWVPLGYDADGRTLTINEAEAATIRQLFRLYLDLGTVAAVEEEAKRLGLITKRYVARNGRQTGGLPFSRGHLYKILSNPLYVGEIAHRDRRYGGQHPAIVDRTTWDAVQAQLKSHTHERQVRSKASEPNLLAGLLVDENGGKFTSTHAVRHGKRYRYYVASVTGQPNGSAHRMPAHEVETQVTGELAAFLADQLRLAKALEPWRLSPDHLEAAFHSGEVLAKKLVSSNACRREAIVQAVAGVQAQKCGLTIQLRPDALLDRAGMVNRSGGSPLCIQIGVALERRGAEKLLLPGAESSSLTDPTLIKVIARGSAWFEELATGRATTIAEIAGREGVTDRYVSSLLKLAFLPPALIHACLTGGPTKLSAAALLGPSGLPILWAGYGGEVTRAAGM